MKSTKRTLFSSVMALFLCFAMLLGTTYAWFTDEVTSANNVIQSGNLDADVYYGDPTAANSIAGVGKLFTDVELWEPGAVAWENLTVVNKGTLAFKYQLTVSYVNENYVVEDGVNTYGLSDILEVGYLAGGVPDGATREEVLAAIPDGDWLPMRDIQMEELLLKAGEADETFALVIRWNPSMADNNYNVNNGKTTSDGAKNLHIDLGVTLLATQATYEEDSFDEKYDKDATYPAITSGALLPGATEALALTVGVVTVRVPETAAAGVYTLDVSKLEITEDANGDSILDADIALRLDGAPVPPADYKVEIDVGLMSEIKEVLHKGASVGTFEYSPFFGVVSFATQSFSPFSVKYEVFGTEVVVDAENGKIHHGFYTKDPTELDSSLKGVDGDSEYMYVEFDKDGVHYWAVSKRATTVILDPIQSSGKLWSIIRDLQSNDHSTVYLKPGTYNEATTIYIYSSMEIIGLGDTEDIKVVKGSSSNSNRHLFNATGDKEKHIEVTIRNMTLDATAKTTGGKDNAAVQSIRKSKVKCYDLDIIKGTGLDAVAFYVNGNNPASDGVKYPAYMYVENCTLNATRTFSVVSTAGKYKFYHQNLTYGAALYTKNSGSIKNQPMEWDDWDWES